MPDTEPKKPKAKQPKKSSKKVDARVGELEEQVTALTEDVKRAQADFVNFKRRADIDRQSSREYGQREIIVKLLPVFDTLDRALSHMPDDLADNEWAQGVANTAKQLDSQLANLKVERINQVTVEFDPERHEAVSIDEGDGDTEVVSEVLQAGYTLEGNVIRPAMVKVGRK